MPKPFERSFPHRRNLKQSLVFRQLVHASTKTGHVTKGYGLSMLA